MRWNNQVSALAGFVSMIGIWWLCAVLQYVSPLFVPAPASVAVAWWHLAREGALFYDMLYTLGRVGAGLLVACICAIPLGFAMGLNARLYAILHSPAEFFRTIPATALFPLCIIFLGIGDLSKIALIAYSSGLTLLVNVMHGVHSGSPIRRRAMRVFGVRGWLLFRMVILPEALPALFAGLRIAVSLAMVVGIVTEMFIGTTAGIGYRIITAQQLYNTAELYAMLITTGLLGIALNRIVAEIEKRTTKG
jgi:ABC-type nitrate/sulfonate/bicarbonate transport system permease component